MTPLFEMIDIDTIIKLSRHGIDVQYQPPVEDKTTNDHNQNITTPSEPVTETTLLTTPSC